MATAKNMKQLNQLLQNQLNRAMKESAHEALSDMRDETVGFYTDTSPEKYNRTGSLGETPRVSTVEYITNGDIQVASFRAYLDTNYTYTTGKRPSMATVLDIANRGLTAAKQHQMRNVVGNIGIWDDALVNIEKSFDQIMRKYFDKT